MKIFEEDKEKIKSFRKAGLSFKAIGKRFDCTASAVLRRYRKWGFEESQEAFQKKISAKVAQVNQFILDKERNEDSYKESLKVLFEIGEKKKKPKQVKTEEVETPAFWGGGSVVEETDKICRTEGEDGLIRRRKTKIYRSTEASRKAYLERQKYYKGSS